VWLWRSPHGPHYLVTNAGIHNLGQGSIRSPHLARRNTR
jgi:hypothetical protein